MKLKGSSRGGRRKAENREGFHGAERVPPLREGGSGREGRRVNEGRRIGERCMFKGRFCGKQSIFLFLKSVCTTKGKNSESKRKRRGKEEECGGNDRSKEGRGGVGESKRSGRVGRMTVGAKERERQEGVVRSRE